MAEEVLISEFDKNAREKVRVKLTEYGGHKLIDIRAYWPDGSTGELRPGKGLSVKRELIPELRAALEGAPEGGSG